MIVTSFHWCNYTRCECVKWPSSKEKKQLLLICLPITVFGHLSRLCFGLSFTDSGHEMAEWVWFFCNLVFTVPPMIVSGSGWKTGSYSMHIETNTLHTSRSRPIKLLGGWPSWKGEVIHTLYSQGGRVGGWNTHWIIAKCKSLSRANSFVAI